MSRDQPSNIVYVSGKFLEREDDIRTAFQHHDLVELRAKDASIELAIQLAEHFVKKGWATYEQFKSSLTTNQEGQSIPQILIKLNYCPEEPKDKAPERREKAERKEAAPQRKEYRQRERDTYRQEEREGRGNGYGSGKHYRN